jgi:hypothetical protein
MKTKTNVRDKERKARWTKWLQKIIDDNAFTWGAPFKDLLGNEVQRYHIEDANFENLLIDLLDCVEGIYEEGLAAGIIERVE